MSSVLSIALMGAMVLYHFKLYLVGPLYEMEIPADILDTLKEEAVNLGSTRPPENPPSEFIAEVELLIKTSFVKSFNRVAFISSAATWVSAILCFVFLKNRKN